MSIRTASAACPDYAIAMTAGQVTALMEDRALVEIEVTAVLPEA